MAAPRTTTWELEPHTRAKHEILGRYLAAWTPILAGGGFNQLLYVDGFAGPGRYLEGEDGSPVIALKAALAHRDRISAKVLFLFIEQDEKRARVLEQVVDEIDRPANFRVRVVGGTRFEEGYTQILRFYADRNVPSPPTFAFIDPFGWKGIRFSLVKSILDRPSCEVLVNFMYEEINRFLGHPDQEANLDALFGCTEWREIIAVQKPTERRTAIRGLYQRQLQTAAKYVRSFEMRNKKDVTDYFLFFATNSLKGLKKMKEAMWNVDEAGTFTFSDATAGGQLQLFQKKPDLASLERAVLAHFDGREVTVGEIELHVVEETPYRETHYKGVLASLEKQGHLKVTNAKPGRRVGTFADAAMHVRISR